MNVENLGEKTPTEALIAVIEEFGKAEPNNVIILWENEEAVCMIRNHVSHAEAYGMLSLAAATVKERFLKTWEAEN